MDRKPLKPAPFHILLALARGDSYGYAIMQTVRDDSDRRIPLRTGSFYRHLSTLLEAGLVVETEAPKPTDPRRGTYYRLTSSGRATLEQEARHWERVVALVRQAPTEESH